MYESLKKTCSDFHLYIFAFDDKSYQILNQLKLEGVTVISLSEFENEELLSIKPSRTRGEYCWTCTPHTVLYCIKKFNLPQCTYVDADLCFYSDPSVLLNEMGNNSILITEHRYTRQYDQSQTHGIYCVQFISFKNTADGMTALLWWKDRCIEWCFNRLEDGKFGDQKYLDDWTTRFKGVHVLMHLGGGVAPWNIQQYKLSLDDDGMWWVFDKATGKEERLVFYHFHYVKFLEADRIDISDYKLTFPGVFTLYADYLKRIGEVNLRFLSKFNLVIPPQPFRTKRMWLMPLDILKRKLRGVYNVFEQKSFINKWLT